MVRSNPKLLWLPSSAKIKGCQGIPKGLERSLALLMVYIVFLAVMDNTTGQSTCYENGNPCRANRSGNLPRLCFSPTSPAISCIVFGCLYMFMVLMFSVRRENHVVDYIIYRECTRSFDNDQSSKKRSPSLQIKSWQVIFNHHPKAVSQKGQGPDPSRIPFVYTVVN